jgi:aspartate carbamoyltransferase catalytic subunit
MMSVREKKGRLSGLKLAMIGDIAHSRVARSDIAGFSKMGARVWVCAPQTMIPAGIQDLGCTVAPTMEACVADADVIMMLRIQKERMSDVLFPTEREYAGWFGLNRDRVALAKQDVVIMHPGPMNRGVEISSDVADAGYSIILDQVTNGVALRMALYYLVAGGGRHADTD